MAGLLKRFRRRLFTDRERRAAVRAVGKELRLKYRTRNPLLPSRYHFLEELRSGSSEADWYAFNTLTGYYKGLYVKFFDCCQRDMRDHPAAWFSCLLYHHEQNFPEVRIHRRHASGMERYLTSESGRAVEIKAGPPQFRRDFVVKSSDPEFASRVCTEPLMYYLIGTGEGACEIERNVVCLRLPRRIAPGEIEMQLDRLIRLQKYLPQEARPADEPI